MKKGIKLCALSGALLLSGCYLKVDVVGQGTVTDTLSGITCVDSCIKRSVGSFKQAILTAEAAPGYQFVGFVEDYKDPYTDYVRVNEKSLNIIYGYGYLYVGDTEPLALVQARSKVTAVFLPEGSVQQSQHTTGSLCVLGQDQSLQCWGKMQPVVAKLTDTVTGIVAEPGNFVTSNQWCLLTDSALKCWNETTLQSWPIPSSITSPTSAALSNDIVCVIDQGNGVPTLSCLHEDGSPLLGTPDITNPEQVSVNESGQFCAEANGGTQCWNAIDTL